MQDPGHQSIKLRGIVLRFLQGESITIINIGLRVECEQSKIICSSLYRAIPIDDKDDPFIPAILGSLNIRKNHHGSFAHYEQLLKKSKNYHELLKNLYHDGHHHVGTLLTLIEDAKPKHKWTIPLIVGALGVSLSAIFIYFNTQYIARLIAWLARKFPLVARWMNKSFTLLSNIPLVGILYDSIAMLLSWHRTFANGTITTSTKLSRLFFKTLTASFEIAAFTLSFLAAGAMTLPAALLSVLSSSVDVFQAVFVWYKSQRALQKLTLLKPKLGTEATWETLAEHERAKNLHQRALDSVWIKLGAAISKTVLVGVWSFFPSSLLVTICCLSLIVLITLVARSIILIINEVSAHSLQKALKRIQVIPNKDLSLHDAAALLEQQQATPQLVKSSTSKVLHGLKQRLSPPAPSAHLEKFAPVSYQPILTDTRERTLPHTVINIDPNDLPNRFAI